MSKRLFTARELLLRAMAVCSKYRVAIFAGLDVMFCTKMLSASPTKKSRINMVGELNTSDASHSLQSELDES